MNNQFYSGKFTKKELIHSICNRFESSPKNCLYVNNKYEINHKVQEHQEIKAKSRKKLIIFNVVVLVVLVGIAAFLIFLIYQKIYQRILANRVEQIVQESVTFHYSRIE